MKYGVSDCLMTAFFLGLAFGLVYEALRIVRLIFRRRIMTFLCDIAFFVLSGFAIMQLSLLLGDFIRYYVILGFFAGVFCYIVTVGRIANGIEQGFAIIFRKTVGRLIRFLKRRLKAGVRAFAQFVKSIIGTIYNFSSIRTKSLKKHLISKRHIVYNNLYKDNQNYAQRENIRGSEKRNVIQANVTRGTGKKASHGAS